MFGEKAVRRKDIKDIEMQQKYLAGFKPTILQLMFSIWTLKLMDATPFNFFFRVIPNTCKVLVPFKVLLNFSQNPVNWKKRLIWIKVPQR